MQKTFRHRVLIAGLIVSLIANPAWAMIVVTDIKPKSNSTRPKTLNVLGSGTVTAMGGDDVGRYSWQFGFGVKTPAGLWNPDLQEAISTVNAGSWAHTLIAPPWTVSPPMLPMTMLTPDHFARVTMTLNADPTNITIFETNNHTVTN